MSMIRYLPICSVLLLNHGIFLIVFKMVLEKLLCFRFENLFLHELVEGKWLDKDSEARRMVLSFGCSSNFR